MSSPPKFLLVSIVHNDIETNEDIEAIRFQSMGQAQYLINFCGHKYSLKQVVLSSSTKNRFGHYCGISVVKGKLMFYDGIPSSNPQLRFIHPEQRFGTLLKGAFISALVYMRWLPDSEYFLNPITLAYGGYGRDDADPELEEDDKDSTATLVQNLRKMTQPKATRAKKKPPTKSGSAKDNPKSPVMLAHQKNLIELSKSKSKLAPEKRKNSSVDKAVIRKNRQYYPVGISVVKVCKGGNLPKCRECGDMILRTTSQFYAPNDSWHTVVRKKHDDYDRHLSDRHYCLDCVELLTPPERKKLKTLVENHKKLDDIDKSIAILKLYRYDPEK